jgi:hypothetical protein
MLAEVVIPMRLVHFDLTILRACMAESMAGAVTDGTLKRAGARMGNNSLLFSATNHFISLSITSPDGAFPWRFRSAFLSTTPVTFPVGTEKTVVQMNWRVVPYQIDPYGGGTGAEGLVLWDHTADT